jgi:hypothetical protein
MQLQLKRALE